MPGGDNAVKEDGAFTFVNGSALDSGWRNAAQRRFYDARATRKTCLMPEVGQVPCVQARRARVCALTPAKGSHRVDVNSLITASPQIPLTGSKRDAVLTGSFSAQRP